MTRFDLKQPMNHFAVAVGAITLMACLTAGAQTTTVPVKPVPAKKVAAHPASAKTATPAPVAKTTTATPAPVAKTATTTTTSATQTAPVAGTAVTPASSQTVLTPANALSTVTSSNPVSTVMSSSPVSSVMSSAPVSSVLSSTPGSTAATAANALTSTNGATNSTSNAAAPGDSRAPVAAQGVGSFLWPGGWTLTAYGCFRTGTRLFCDFDTTNQNNLQADTSIWSGGGGVDLVDDGGKITRRHNAFFVGSDGSQFTTAYISPQPVRFIIEYDDVDQRYTSISLILGRERIQAIPITLIDPSQPAGRIPARAFANAPGMQPAAARGNGVPN
jgi:hypothetical protein